VSSAGGKLLAASLCRDLELQPVPEFEALFGINEDSEEAWGHATYDVHAPAGFSALAKIPSFHTEKGWLGLDAAVEKLAVARVARSTTTASQIPGITDVHPASALFRKIFPAGGQAILYTGFVNFVRDPQALFADPGVIAAVLDDACAQSGVAPLGTQDGELARARVDGKTLILREDAIAEL
jgi:hypothetical protein